MKVYNSVNYFLFSILGAEERAKMKGIAEGLLLTYHRNISFNVEWF